jgi:hypothetical protein
MYLLRSGRAIHTSIAPPRNRRHNGIKQFPFAEQTHSNM